MLRAWSPRPPKSVARERSTPAVLGSGPFTARMPNPPGSLLGCGDSAACRISALLIVRADPAGKRYWPLLFASREMLSLLSYCQPNQGPVLKSPSHQLSYHESATNPMTSHSSWWKHHFAMVFLWFLPSTMCHSGTRLHHLSPVLRAQPLRAPLEWPGAP